MLGTGQMFQAGDANAASALPSFPYVPAYVPMPTATESAAPMETDGVAASKKEPMDEEKKQKYAGDLIGKSFPASKYQLLLILPVWQRQPSKPFTRSGRRRTSQSTFPSPAQSRATGVSESRHQK